jgi:tetratricopeptide (TPR) repeat protein
MGSHAEDGEMTPEWLLRKTIAIVSGTGAAHEQVSTKSDAAQRYYDQGLSLLYSYDWIRAAQSFHEALRRDPQLAMAYLGLSYAYSGLGDQKGAEAMARQAEQKAGGASPRERRRIELRKKQFKAMAKEEAGEHEASYENAIDAALRETGEDTIMLLLRGNATEGFAAGMGQRGRKDSVSYYERVLQLEPQNFAAHHFLTHSYELMGDQEKAVSHAKGYQALAPAMSHAHHMYGHELMRKGELAAAIGQFEKADRLESGTAGASSEELLYDWHYRHNLSLLASAYRQAGDLKRAEEVLARLSRLRAVTPVDEYYKGKLAAFLLQTGRYQEALAAAGALLKAKSSLARAAGHAYQGSAQAALKNEAQAREELSAAEAEARSLNPRWRSFLNPDLQMLRLQVALAGPALEGAIQGFQQEETKMRALAGTDAWSDALFRLEFIARAARESGAWSLAGSTAEQMKQHAPGYFGTHVALAEAAQHRGDLVNYQAEMETARQSRKR